MSTPVVIASLPWRGLLVRREEAGSKSRSASGRSWGRPSYRAGVVCLRVRSWPG